MTDAPASNDPIPIVDVSASSDQNQKIDIATLFSYEPSLYKATAFSTKTTAASEGIDITADGVEANSDSANKDVVIAPKGTGKTKVTELGSSDLDMTEQSMKLSPSLSSDHSYSGVKIRATAGETVVYGELCYFNGTDGEYKKADADAAGTMPGVAIALEGKDDGEACDFFTYGFIRDDSWAWTPGGLLYASCTAGDLIQTAPSGSGDQVQVLGYAYSADIIFFNPSLVLVEVS